MRSAFAIALCAVLAGCATTGGEPPDTARDIGHAAGAAAAAVLDQLPVVNTALDAVDEARRKVSDLRARRQAARGAERVESRLWEQCRENPCLYAARCAELFPDEFMVPDCGDAETAARDPHGDARTSTATRDPRAAASLRDTIKAAEGVVHEPRGGHVCHGHWITEAERADPRFAAGRAWTPAECDALLDEDIAEARREALRVFGRADDARAELCYWKPCARMFGHVDPGDLAGAVATSERLLSIDPARTRRIAAAL